MGYWSYVLAAIGITGISDTSGMRWMPQELTIRKLYASGEISLGSISRKVKDLDDLCHAR